jgi:hypothetical protein
MKTESILKSTSSLTPQPAGCLSKELLAVFVSHETEKIDSGIHPVTYRSLYEIWTYHNGKGNTYRNLLEQVTRNGISCDGGLFGGPEARRRLAEARARIRREVELKRIADDIFLIRFFDPQRSKDDLPDITFKSNTWAPYHGKRVTNTDAPGYYVQYGVWNSEMSSLLARIGKPSGQIIGLDAALISEYEISDESIQSLTADDPSKAKEFGGLYIGRSPRIEERNISATLAKPTGSCVKPIRTFKSVG